MNQLTIKNALPEYVAENIRKTFIDAEWDHLPFEDPEYYKKQYNGYPSNEEIYTTDFWKSYSLINNPIILECVSHILNIIDTTLTGNMKVDRNSVSLLAYKLTPGGHLRMHNDEYAADVGFIWYLSKNWSWDWGGLLISLSSTDSSPTVEMPEFNKLIILNHSSAISHCVTSVERWARDDRYMLVGMMRVV